jgi:hypothetical protein
LDAWHHRQNSQTLLNYETNPAKKLICHRETLAMDNATREKIGKWT